ncbi:MAG: hypothetical protein L0Y60_04220 [Beijerinckiaceae bacterium]|nr:hypothetical protein [Beijerinckiaceae bacterium]
MNPKPSTPMALLLAALVALAPAAGEAQGAFSGGKNIVVLSAASNNSQLVGIPGPHLLFGITALNTAASDVFLRLYDVASAPDCTSSVGAVALYPVFAKASGGGFVGHIPSTFQHGLGICITGGYGLTDNTNAVTGAAITFTLK